MKLSKVKLSIGGVRYRLLSSAVLAVVQVIISALILFYLYRFLMKTLGVEALGVWSLVAAASSLASISSLGLAGGITHFVAKYLARGEALQAKQIIETAILSVTAIMGLVLLLLWSNIKEILLLVVPEKWLIQAIEVAPYILFSLWMSTIGGLINSALDGCRRADLRSLNSIISNPILPILAICFVPHTGLIGLALAQICQYITWLLGGWLLLRREIPVLSLVPLFWGKTAFRQICSYGLAFQFVGLLTILSEPFAKVMISQAAGVSSVGYFEMANRFVMTLRSIILSANQILVGYYSRAIETDSEKVLVIYRNNIQINIIFSTIAFSVIGGALPLVSILWIGYVDEMLINWSGLLMVGWYLSILSAPAYFISLGGGRLWPIILGHAVIPASLLLFWTISRDSALFKFYELAWPLAIAAGAIVVITSAHRYYKMSYDALLNLENLSIFMSGVAICLGGFLAIKAILDNQMNVTFAFAISVISLILWFMILRASDRNWAVISAAVGLKNTFEISK